MKGRRRRSSKLLEQLDWKAPDYLIVPGGNLGNSAAFGKALVELQAAGLLDKASAPRRGAGGRRQSVCPDVALRLDGTGASREPETVASAIRIGNPRSWKKALRAVQHTNGWVMDVSDEEIGEAKAMIGRDGIGCEPASATTLAALRKLTAQRANRSRCRRSSPSSPVMLSKTPTSSSSRSRWNRHV